MKIPFMKMLNTKLSVDLVSDLHIDQWSTKYNKPYPSGEVKNFPFEFDKTGSKYLVVAGDISDNINWSLDYLDKVSNKYEKILFVEGNHEHVNRYPNLYTKSDITSLIKNDKLIYLPEKSYVIDDTVFIGSCGWWDYGNGNIDMIKKNYNYFEHWIKKFGKNENIEFIYNVIDRSLEEYEYLKCEIEKYEKDENIENIVLVTHTVPLKIFCYMVDKNLELNYSTQYNTKYSELLSYSKISNWFFGHSHDKHELYLDNINFISNPRGRPHDKNRVRYSVNTIEI